MLIDFRELGARAELDCDVCVIGGGAAGIALAKALEGSALDVCLIESGGVVRDAQTQALYRGASVGLGYPALDTCRLRYLGGTTNHWSGWCRPLDAIDFERRDWVPESGWPIAAAEIAAYLDRARALCEVPATLSSEELWKCRGVEPLELDPRALQAPVWQFSPPTRFGERYREELGKSQNVRVYLHANAVNLATPSQADHVTHVDLAALSGATGRVRAHCYVLATGGIENARLLLASNRVVRCGLGNQRDLVGRHFMEHPHVALGELAAVDHFRLLECIGLFYACQAWWQTGFALAPAEQRARRTLGCAATVRYREERPLHCDELLMELRKGHAFERGSTLDRIWRRARDADAYLYNLYRAALGAPHLPLPHSVRDFLLLGIVEQAPDPASRVLLSAERDPLGVPRITLDWRLGSLEKHTLRTMAEVTAAELGRLQLGRLRLDPWLLEDTDLSVPQVHDSRAIDIGAHHAGTTRMAEDPRHGVVDPDLRVHGIDNLYVAGSSVFPSCGYANPTLTIVALALRLAEHLRSKIGSNSPTLRWKEEP